MKQFVCSVCGFIYDEAKGLPELPPFFVPITMLVRNLSLSGNRSGA